MKIEVDEVLRHSRQAVFYAYRDELAAFVEFLPNVRSIEVVERVEFPSRRVELHNVWSGGTELPANLSRHLEERFLSWDDHAVWDESTWSCDWKIQTHACREAIECVGRLDFIALGDLRTRVELTGELKTDFDRMGAVPTFLAGSIGRKVENFLVRQITSNLVSVTRALAAYLQEDTTAG